MKGHQKSEINQKSSKSPICKNNIATEEIDEEIEALLYAQVYYGKPDSTDVDESAKINSSEIPHIVTEFVSKDNSVGVDTQDKNSTDNNCCNLDKEVQSTVEGTINKLEQISSQTDSQPVLHSDTSESLANPDSFDLVQKQQDQNSVDILQPYIEISTSSANTVTTEPAQIVAQIPLATSTNQQQLLNNITINQYIYSNESFLNRLKQYRDTIIWSKQCQKDLKRLEKGKINEAEFFKNLNRRRKSQKSNLKKQEQIRQAFFRRKQKIASSEVICLSDSDNSDVEFIGAEPAQRAFTKAGRGLKKYTSMTSKNESKMVTASIDDSDDEEAIIYVPPPPVPVIDVDENSNSDSPEGEISVVMEPTNEPEKVRDNDDDVDFLMASGNSSQQFNFGLHGHEFQDAEFVRPANPTDYYETESSTSTSDFNRDSSRDFSNSVKTIVFNEVDFPREDIFEGSNMEKFGELITTNRSSQAAVENDGETEGEESLKNPKKATDRTLSESSSESDYEPVITHQNLPVLSPMICTDVSLNKGIKLKITGIDGAKKKSKRNVTEGNDSEALESENIEESSASSAKKRRGSGVDLDETVSRKKAKKKKRKSGSRIEDTDASINETEIPPNPEDPGSPQRKLRSDWIITSTPKISSTDASDSTFDQSKTKKKNKKKKKQTKDTEDHDDDADTNTSAAESSRKKHKKRKEKALSEDESDMANTTDASAVIQTEEGNKKKSKNKKRRSQSSGKVSDDDGKLLSSLLSHQGNNQTLENVEVTANLQDSETVADDETASAGTQRKKKQTSVDKRNDDVARMELATVNDSGMVTDEITANQRKNKKKKRASLDKRNDCVTQVELSNPVVEENEVLGEENIVQLPQQCESLLGEKVQHENVEDEEDIVLIEPVIPVHTIESSDTEDDDIISFGGIGEELELANISDKNNIEDIVKMTIEDVVKASGNDATDIFDIDYIKSKMSDDPQKWKIASSDLLKSNANNKRRMRCNKCREIGHIAINCRNKPEIPSCNLCGLEGHQEPRCPNKICLTCAQPGSYSTVFCYKCVKQRKSRCTLCNEPGHLRTYCPDLWRRYFLTTKEGPLVKPKTGAFLKPRSQQWCSGCASKGHLENECDSYKWMRQYPVSSPTIFEYRDVYESGNKKKTASNSPKTLLETPSSNVAAASSNSTETAVDVSQNSVDKNIGTAEDTVTVPVEIETPTEVSKNTPSSTENQITPQALEENHTLPRIDSECVNAEPELPQDEDAITNTEEPSVSASTESAELPKGDPTANKEAPRELDTETSKSNEVSIRSKKSNRNNNQQPNQFAKEHERKQPLYEPYNRYRDRNRVRKSTNRRAKLNPVSVLRASSEPYTPYSSVFNPYSVLRAPPVSNEPYIIDTDPGAYIDTGINNYVPEMHNPPNLFKPTPTEILVHQLTDLRHYITTRRETYSGNNQYYPQHNLHQQSQYGPETPQNHSYTFGPTNTYSNAHIQNDYGDRDFLHVPYTITSQPSYNLDYRDTDQGSSRILSDHQNFKSSDSTTGTPSVSVTQLNSDNMISFDDNRKGTAYKLCKLNNVEEPLVKKFMSSSVSEITEFLESELSKLNSIKCEDIKLYRKKLNQINQLQKIDVKTKVVKKQINFQFKQINMFLFGALKLANGKRNLDLLMNFIYNPGKSLSSEKRRSLIDSYGYIFGGEHRNFNYRKKFNELSVGSNRKR